MKEPLYIVEVMNDGTAIAKRQVNGISVSAVDFSDVAAALAYADEKVRDIKRMEAGLGR